MKKTKTIAYDASEYLVTEEDINAYFETALEDGDPALVIQALGNIAKARGMTEISKKTGLARESLYKALSRGGNPAFSTVLKVVNALGIKLKAETSQAAA
jgi:probable addiction module antidote protein